MPVILAYFRRSTALMGKLFLLVVLAFHVCPILADDAPTSPTTSPANTNSPVADKAWKEVQKAAQPPAPPSEWQQHRPTREQVAAYYTPLILKGADLAKEFYTHYPDHPKAAEAHKIEYKLLNIVVQQFGDSSQKDRIAAVETARAKDPSTSEDERFDLRMTAAQRLLLELPDKMDELIKAVRELRKDFPKREEVYGLVQMLLVQGESEKTRALAREILDDNAPDPIKDLAKKLETRMNALGKPLALKYVAADGREVDLAKLKGKVVLVDFWATWCPPCVAEMPHVKSTYAKLHEQGFEIIGISLDADKEAMDRFVTENKMAWPQFFDGKRWENKFVLEHGIVSVPAMWLVDKKGVLSDIHGQVNLEDKLTKLLAE